MNRVIRIDVSLRGQGQAIGPGDYQVSVRDENGSFIVLTGKSHSYQLAAFKRSSKMAVKQLTSELRRVLREPRYLLIVRVPPATELVVSLDMTS